MAKKKKFKKDKLGKKYPLYDTPLMRLFGLDK